MDLVEDVADPALPIVAACSALGLSRATLYRATTPASPPTLRKRPPSPRRLGDEERRVIADVMHSPEFVDQPPSWPESARTAHAVVRGMPNMLIPPPEHPPGAALKFLRARPKTERMGRWTTIRLGPQPPRLRRVVRPAPAGCSAPAHRHLAGQSAWHRPICSGSPTTRQPASHSGSHGYSMRTLAKSSACKLTTTFGTTGLETHVWFITLG